MSQESNAIASDGRRIFRLLRQLGFLAAVVAVLGIAACTKKMPDEVGKDQETATKELEKLKLTVQVTTQQSDKTPGTVIDQEPKAKEKLPESKIASLVVAAGGSGPSGAPEQPVGGLLVPAVEGMSLAEAIGQIAKTGLRTRIERIENAPQQGDVVLSLNPMSGTIVRPDQEITVRVPDTLVTVPSVIGMPQVQAVVQLTLKGLKLGQSKSQIEGAGAVGTVIDQFPKPNDKVAIGLEVQLTVKGAAVTMPTVTGTDVAVASNNVKAAGLTVAIQWDETSTRPAGNVILQRPSPGFQASPGSEAVLTVAGRQPQTFVFDKTFIKLSPIQRIKDLKPQ